MGEREIAPRDLADPIERTNEIASIATERIECDPRLVDAASLVRRDNSAPCAPYHDEGLKPPATIGVVSFT